jgi:ATP-dependent Clp protease protease subunit
MRIINKYISVSDSAKNESAEINIYGDICDEKWFDEDVTPKAILDALDDAGAVKNLNIHINSYGGSVFAGNAIVNILDSYKRKSGATINVYNDGLAASMASGIACAGDKVYAAKNSLFMYHKPLMVMQGNAEDFESAISVLNKTEDALVSNYMRKFNGTEEELRDMLAKETWLTADEAKEYGFVDEIIEANKIAASANGIRINDQTFDGRVADIVKNKYPDITIEKEEPKLKYDEALNAFGIDETMFNTLDMESDKLMQIANTVKTAVTPEPVAEFIAQDAAIAALGKDDITADEVLNFAKAGMNPVDTTAIQNKANEYDKIVEKARADALVNAMKAQGDSYNEQRMKKYLDVLDYSEIVDQSNAWNEEAKKILHAGYRGSQPNSALNNTKEKPVNKADYDI